MTLELGGILDPQLQRNMQLIDQRLIDTGGRSVGVRFGATGAINAGTNATITHGLGKAPVAVFTQTATGQVVLGLDLGGAPTFRATNASATNTTGYWMVIG